MPSRLTIWEDAGLYGGHAAFQDDATTIGVIVFPPVGYHWAEGRSHRIEVSRPKRKGESGWKLVCEEANRAMQGGLERCHFQDESCCLANRWTHPDDQD